MIGIVSLKQKFHSETKVLFSTDIFQLENFTELQRFSSLIDLTEARFLLNASPFWKIESKVIYSEAR